jgi:hypothetical protein
LSKKRQIPQIDGCCSPPSPPLPPSPSTPCQPATECEDDPPPEPETSTSLPTLQAPAPPQVLLPRRAPSPIVLAPPSPSTPCQPATEFEDDPPPEPEISSSLPALQAPAPPQALSPHRAPSPLVLAPGISSPAPARPPAPSAARPAEISSTARSGYTLVMIWCPSCKKNLIDNHDFECYMCQERRYYLSLQYKDE